MIDSTNPRILANNIRALAKKIASIVPGTVVEGNPSGSGFNTLLTKIKIGSTKYKLPDQVTANPEGDPTNTLEKLGIGGEIYSISQASETVPIEYCEENLTFSSGEAWLKDKDGNQLVAGDVVLTAFGLTETPNKHVYNVYIDSGKLKARAINGLNDTGYSYNGTTNLAVVYIKKQTS